MGQQQGKETREERGLQVGGRLGQEEADLSETPDLLNTDQLTCLAGSSSMTSLEDRCYIICRQA